MRLFSNFSGECFENWVNFQPSSSTNNSVYRLVWWGGWNLPRFNNNQKNLEFQMLAAIYHKDDHEEYCHTLKWESRFFLGPDTAKITNYIKQLIVQMKIIENWISYRKVSGRTYLSPPGMELVGLKDWYVSNIILYWSGKVDSFLGWRLPKSKIISNNCSNKNRTELNFVQKSHRAHMTISRRSGAKRFERLSSLKYYNALRNGN